MTSRPMAERAALAGAAREDVGLEGNIVQGWPRLWVDFHSLQSGLPAKLLGELGNYGSTLCISCLKRAPAARRFSGGHGR